MRLLVFFLLLVSLCQAQPQILLGMTKQGGQSNYGAVFSFTIDSGIEVVRSLDSSNGAYPYGSIMETLQGGVFGVTYAGGTANSGVIFSYDYFSDTLLYNTVLHNFGQGNDGASPTGSLFQAGDGVLYGLTYIGGTYNQGAIFSYNISWDSEAVLYSFKDSADGGLPHGSLIQANDYLLYGTTTSGGAHNMGTIFSYNISTDVQVVSHSFSNNSDGQTPEGSLIQATDSFLYGMAHYGGLYAKGIIFNYNIFTGAYRILHSFRGNDDGQYPTGSLLKANNGMIYGMTPGGGTVNQGVIFSYSILTDTISVIHNFGIDSDGAFPYGSLIQVEDSLLYGITSLGGANNIGTVFSYNINTSNEKVLTSFNGQNGNCAGWNGDLMEVHAAVENIVNLTIPQLQISPNPTTGQFTIQLPGNKTSYTAEIYNTLGQKVEQLTLTNTTNTLNLNTQPTGMYFINVQTEEGNFTGKIMIVR